LRIDCRAWRFILTAGTDAKGISGALTNGGHDMDWLTIPSSNPPPLDCWRMLRQSHD